jgi:hypothetical protein
VAHGLFRASFGACSATFKGVQGVNSIMIKCLPGAVTYYVASCQVHSMGWLIRVKVGLASGTA